MDIENLRKWAGALRLALRELFGSRLAAQLEEDLMRLRADSGERLHEREIVIADLREQLAQANAKIERYELVIIPIASPVGALFSPKRPVPTFPSSTEPIPSSWHAIQAEYEREQDELAKAEKEKPDGVPSEGR